MKPTNSSNEARPSFPSCPDVDKSQRGRDLVAATISDDQCDDADKHTPQHCSKLPKTNPTTTPATTSRNDDGDDIFKTWQVGKDKIIHFKNEMATIFIKPKANNMKRNPFRKTRSSITPHRQQQYTRRYNKSSLTCVSPTPILIGKPLQRRVGHGNVVTKRRCVRPIPIRTTTKTKIIQTKTKITVDGTTTPLDTVFSTDGPSARVAATSIGNSTEQLLPSRFPHNISHEWQQSASNAPKRNRNGRAPACNNKPKKNVKSAAIKAKQSPPPSYYCQDSRSNKWIFGEAKHFQLSLLDYAAAATTAADATPITPSLLKWQHQPDERIDISNHRVFTISNTNLQPTITSLSTMMTTTTTSFDQYYPSDHHITVFPMLLSNDCHRHLVGSDNNNNRSNNSAYQTPSFQSLAWDAECSYDQTDDDQHVQNSSSMVITPCSELDQGEEEGGEIVDLTIHNDAEEYDDVIDSHDTSLLFFPCLSWTNTNGGNHEIDASAANDDDDDDSSSIACFLDDIFSPPATLEDDLHHNSSSTTFTIKQNLPVMINDSTSTSSSASSSSTSLLEEWILDINDDEILMEH